MPAGSGLRMEWLARVERHDLTSTQPPPCCVESYRERLDMSHPSFSLVSCSLEIRRHGIALPGLAGC
jgi:hypothetical protein